MIDSMPIKKTKNMKKIHSITEYLNYINALLGLAAFNTIISLKFTTVGTNQGVVELVKFQAQ